MMKHIKEEFKTIKKTSKPNTIKSLKEDFNVLGVEKGNIILMHSSLSQLGWTVGGPVSVIDAILEIISNEGTLIMPTFSSGNTDPSEWESPPVPKEWWDDIKTNMPAFHPEKTPTLGIGIIAETFRKYPNVIRSNHPTSSFCAWGKYAKYITENHRIEIDLGEGSPLAKIYELEGKILLLGVGHSSNSSIHLAEYRTNYKEKCYNIQGSAVMVNNERKWIEWKELNVITDDFEDLGRDFEEEIGYISKKVGLADARLFSQRKLVDFAIEWIRENRNPMEG